MILVPRKNLYHNLWGSAHGYLQPQGSTVTQRKETRQVIFLLVLLLQSGAAVVTRGAQIRISELPGVGSNENPQQHPVNTQRSRVTLLVVTA